MMQRALTLSTVASFTERPPSSSRRGCLVSTEVSSQWYVRICNSCWPHKLIRISDDAPRSKFRCSFHYLCNPQATCSGNSTTWSTTAQRYHVRHWRHCWACDCLHHHASRVWTLHLPSLMRTNPLIVSSRRECNPWMREFNTATHSTVLIAYSPRRVF